MAKKPFWKYFLKDEKNVDVYEYDEEEGGVSGSSSSGSSSGSGSGSDSDSGSSGTGRIKPKEGEGFVSYLPEETEHMAYERRGLEQQVERQLAGVEERKKPRRETGNEPGGTEQKLRQHPLLDSQRFDGIDPGLNPAPFGNQEAEIAFENEQREQNMEKQLRLGLAPKMGKSNTPELKMQ